MVKLFVAVTDQAWFDFLSASAPHNEVNFWAPSGHHQFHAIGPGELFLFKLHSPNDFIVGGGVFGHASNAPLSLAWDAFGTKNGVATLDEMRARIAHYRRNVVTGRDDPIVGCRILTQPFFWPREKWIAVPSSWSRNIVRGKTYHANEVSGRLLWDAVHERIVANADFSRERYGAPALVKPRLGQGAFRLSVTDHYERRCAVTGEKTLPLLDAAHIKSFAAGGDHSPSNGLLLRTDVHRLFDLGYVTVAEDGRFEVGRRLKEDFDNGRHYYELHGSPIRSPKSPDAMPSTIALTWHREHRFLG